MVARVAIINNKIWPELGLQSRSQRRFFQNTFLFWLPTIAEGRNLTIFKKRNQNLEILGNCLKKIATIKKHWLEEGTLYP
jgi:hypothetical protein